MPETNNHPSPSPTNESTDNEKVVFGWISINNKMIQQRLTTYQPLLTPRYVIIVFILIGIAFIPIGIGILLAAQSITSTVYRYDQIVNTQCNPAQPDTCMISVDIPITQNMNSPVYFYYELTDYYQNQRRYEQSKSDAQYAADIPGIKISDCNPLAAFYGVDIYPCGITANTMFNDTFAASYTKQSSQQPIMLGGPQSDYNLSTWQKNGIAWSTDVSHKFVPLTPAQIHQLNYIQYGPNTPSGDLLPSVTNEDWMVWMRVAAFPKFKKLYRIINTNLPVGSTLHVNITNIYPVSLYNGSKSIVLSTTSWMGGYNIALGWIYISVGILCIIISCGYGIHFWRDPRLVTDIKDFNFDSFTRPINM